MSTTPSLTQLGDVAGSVSSTSSIPGRDGRGGERPSFLGLPAPEPCPHRLGECEHRGCSEEAIGFNDDSEVLCEDHLFEWATWFSTEPNSDPDGEFAE